MSPPQKNHSKTVQNLTQLPKDVRSDDRVDGGKDRLDLTNHTNQGTIWVFIVFSWDSWGLEPINTDFPVFLGGISLTGTALVGVHPTIP